MKNKYVLNYETEKTENPLATVDAVFALSASAYDFIVDDIAYDINGTEVTVTSGGSYAGSVTIPPAVTFNGTTYPVTSIGEDAFYKCSSLTSVTCNAVVPPVLNNNSFIYDTYKNAILYVPEQSIEAYKTTNNWKRFVTVLPIVNVVAGDVNGDDSVNITDLSDLIDLLLSGNVSADTHAGADVDDDGLVTISDIAALIDYLLTGEQP